MFDANKDTNTCSECGKEKIYNKLFRCAKCSKIFCDACNRGTSLALCLKCYNPFELKTCSKCKKVHKLGGMIIMDEDKEIYECEGCFKKGESG